MGNPDVGDHRNVRLSNITELVDVALVAGPHLQDQDLVVGLQVVINDFTDTHRRIVAAGRGADAVTLLQQIPNHKLGARFAIAACNADHRQLRHGGDLLPGQIYIILMYPLLDGCGKPACQEHPERHQGISQHPAKGQQVNISAVQHWLFERYCSKWNAAEIGPRRHKEW